MQSSKRKTNFSKSLRIFFARFCFLKVLKDGCAVGAAVLGVPAKATIKEVQYTFGKLVKSFAIILVSVIGLVALLYAGQF